MREIQFDEVRKRIEIAYFIDTINRQFQRRKIERRYQTQIGYVKYICIKQQIMVNHYVCFSKSVIKI